MGDHFCLKWNNHQENLTGIMTKLLDEQKFVDVSLVCEMKTFKAHQTVLSACSPYFEQVLEENPHPHPIIILKDVKESEMTALLQYMYRGEVSVRDDELSNFLHTARALKVRGLSENKREIHPLPQEENLQNSAFAQSETVTPPKRPRTSLRTNDQEGLDKHLLDSQSPTGSSSVCKPTVKPSTNAAVPPLMNYSENSSDTHYANPSTPSQTIKQEVETISNPNEEPSAISHLANLEPRSELCPKQGDWNFDYGHPVENRNYQVQKTKEDETLTLREKTLQLLQGNSSGHCEQGSSAPPRASLVDPCRAVAFNGSKQWHIKHSFEKAEGSGFKCKICGQIKKHVRNHYLKHFPEHHECHLCRRTYTRKDNLNSHLKRDHLGRVKTSPEANGRLARLPGRPEGWQALRCYTPEVCPRGRFPVLPAGTASLRPRSASPPGPVDLSLRPSSVPLQPQFIPAYNILPSLCSYLRN